jgi:short-subunit dehydrogenase
MFPVIVIATRATCGSRPLLVITVVQWSGTKGISLGYFDRRVVAITGAGTGIGRELAIQLARSGAALALSGNVEEPLAETAQRCTTAGARASVTVVDVTDREAVTAFATSTAEHFGRVDAVINNAGILYAGDVLASGYADIERVMDVDFWGVVHGTKAFLPHILRSDRGHVVNLSSAFGLMAAPGYSAYNAAKFPVRGFTEALRQEMDSAGHPVKVTCVFPGGVRTSIARTAAAAPGVDLGEVADSFDRRIARTDPAEAARVILRGVERGRARVLVGPDARVVDAVTRLLGPAYQWLLPAAKRRAG